MYDGSVTFVMFKYLDPYVKSFISHFVPLGEMRCGTKEPNASLTPEIWRFTNRTVSFSEALIGIRNDSVSLPRIWSVSYTHLTLPTN